MKRRITMLLAGLFLALGTALAQKVVSGTVISGEDGQPIIGAAIKAVGLNVGTVTDIDGNFSFELPKGESKVVVSYVGMASQTLTGGQGMKITLKPDQKQNLDEVVVVAYGTAKKSAYTGAASEIKAEKIGNRQMSNVSSALVGSMAGVQTIQSSGQPGQETKIRIRGISSINGVTNPLYVVDGVPFDGDLSSINPEDIASMTVLKDAVSTSLYGSRGANGVVMITTKKGKEGKAKFTLDAKWGAVSREVGNYDVIKDPAAYYELLYKGYYNYGITQLNKTAADAHTYANGRILAKPGYQIYTVPTGESLVGIDGKINPNAKLGYSDGNNYFTPDDWQKETFKTTLRQEYNLGVSGASDKFNYYSSLGYLKDDGTIKGSGFDRLTTRLNIEYKARKWLTLGSNIAYTHTKTYSPTDQDEDHTSSSANAFFMANTIAPIYPIYVRDANGNIMKSSITGKTLYDYGDGKSTAFSRNYMSIANPLGDLQYNKREYNMDIFNGNWFARFDLGSGFSATARLGLNSDNTILHNYRNSLYGQSASSGGEIIQESIRTTAFTHQYLLNYLNTFGKNNLNLTVGFEGYRLNVEDISAIGQNIYRLGDSTVGGTIDNRRGDGSIHQYYTAGYFFSGNYNYEERFFVNLGYRRDGSSTFSPDNRWGNFFSVGLGWNLKKEKFLRDIDAFDLLKLRASFGQTGNDNHNVTLINDNTYYSWYSYEDIYKLTGSNGVFSDAALVYKGNPELKWEKTNAFDFGVDYSLWKSRLTGSLDFFFRATSNLLDYKRVAMSNGYSKYPVNMGTIQNYGLEFEANYGIIRNKDFEWDVSFNATWLKNRIKSLSSDYENGQYVNGYRIYREGQSIYNLYLPHYEGVNSDGVALYTGVKMNADGTIYKDANGNKVEESTTDYDNAYEYNRKESGNTFPKMYGGLGTSLKWKGFDFSIQTSFQLGGRVLDEGYRDLMTTGGSDMEIGRNFSKDVYKAWTSDNTSSSIPRLNIGDNYAASISDRFLTSSDYFSIDNITLGYTLPRTWLNRIGFDSIRIFGTAENVVLFSARKGMDPRLSFYSVSTSQYTSRRVISAGIKLGF